MDMTAEKFDSDAEHELERYLIAASKAANYLISKVADNGYISASTSKTASIKSKKHKKIVIAELLNNFEH